MAAAGVAIIGEHHFSVQVVSERDSEKQEDQSAGDGGPLAEVLAGHGAVFARPSRAPEANDDHGDDDPKAVEE